MLDTFTSATCTPVAEDEILAISVVGGLIVKIRMPLVRVQSATFPKYAFGTELTEYVELGAMVCCRFECRLPALPLE